MELSQTDSSLKGIAKIEQQMLVGETDTEPISEKVLIHYRRMPRLMVLTAGWWL